MLYEILYFKRFSASVVLERNIKKNNWISVDLDIYILFYKKRHTRFKKVKVYSFQS